MMHTVIGDNQLDKMSEDEERQLEETCRKLEITMYVRLHDSQYPSLLH